MLSSPLQNKSSIAFSINQSSLTVSVEDMEDEINLAEFIKDFVDKPDVKIAVSYGEEII